MKYKVIQLLSALLIGILGFAMTLVPEVSGLKASVSLSQTVTAGEVKDMVKDETVYGLLSSTGSVQSIHVVNRVAISETGNYRDFGQYASIESLSETLEPTVSGDSINWHLSDASEDFYYQGEMVNKELPWIFKITYKLNGTPTDAEKLSGVTGDIDITVSVAPNAAYPYFTKHYVMQIQVPVDLNNSVVRKADGATQVISGHVATLTYMVLPGTEKTFDISLRARDFEMEGMTIGLSQMDYSALLDMDEMTEGVDALGNGMGEIIGGTEKLQTGLKSLSQGIHTLSGGMDQLSKGAKPLITGMGDYQSGLNQAFQSISAISMGSESVKSGLDSLSNKGNDLLSGYQQLAEGIRAELPTDGEKAQLQYLAQQTQSIDPSMAQMGKMAQSLLKQIEGLEEINQSLGTLNGGLAQYSGGVTQLSQQYQEFNAGLGSLSENADGLMQGYAQILHGNEEYFDSVKKLSAGLYDVDTQVATLPNEVGKLADGQKKLQNGLEEALGALTDMLGDTSDKEVLKSFVSPDKGKVVSVQFVMRTPAIMKGEKAEPAPVVQENKQDFLQKLLALFQ